MDDRKGTLLDLNKLEDLFYCIDVLTRAKFAITESDKFIINQIDTILDTFMNLSEKITSENDNSNYSSSDDIIDIFTGERIKIKKSDIH